MTRARRTKVYPTRLVGIITATPEREEHIVGPIPSGFRVRGGDLCQCFLFESHVGMEVNLRRLHRFVPEPKSDDSLINTVMKEIHGGAVAYVLLGT